MCIWRNPLHTGATRRSPHPMTNSIIARSCRRLRMSTMTASSPCPKTPIRELCNTADGFGWNSGILQLSGPHPHSLDGSPLTASNPIRKGFRLRRRPYIKPLNNNTPTFTQALSKDVSFDNPFTSRRVPGQKPCVIHRVHFGLQAQGRAPRTAGRRESMGERLPGDVTGALAQMVPLAFCFNLLLLMYAPFGSDPMSYGRKLQ